jgi:hypothetical protein
MEKPYTSTLQRDAFVILIRDVMKELSTLPTCLVVASWSSQESYDFVTFVAKTTGEQKKLKASDETARKYARAISHVQEQFFKLYTKTNASRNDLRLLTNQYNPDLWKWNSGKPTAVRGKRERKLPEKKPDSSPSGGRHKLVFDEFVAEEGVASDEQITKALKKCLVLMAKKDIQFLNKKKAVKTWAHKDTTIKKWQAKCNALLVYVEDHKILVGKLLEQFIKALDLPLMALIQERHPDYSQIWTEAAAQGGAEETTVDDDELCRLLGGINGEDESGEETNEEENDEEEVPEVDEYN